ncbi:methyltransferase domain-containing protein [Kutzneria albida]|uniref:Protein-L-isoaspartate O-methyltransferase n=1 Tax=Kutzneria albida DSM 43870 TaxID=1449976 RepID=W5WUD0_9PSEU|nr:methyltransferase domain-containing protein [Kutzneria albida]AHI01755.1 hypothetical protein KALB_8398 [Kutzneria albida DSM 43870]
MGDDLEREAAVLRRQLVDAMLTEDLLTAPHWRAAFQEVPRHLFLPWFFNRLSSGDWSLVTSLDERWLPSVYQDRVLVTQLDGTEIARQAAALGPVSGTPTCSSSMPTIMAIMLEALDVHSGHNVLEIGTGTGYNTALLCHRLGGDLVSTVDVDPDIVARAEENLSRAGYAPASVIGDGALGHAANSPYDRVLCTCSVSRIPLPWLEQTVPGGQVVTTLNRPIGAGLVRLTATGGPHAEGRVLLDDGRFMPLRAHRTAWSGWPRGPQTSRRQTELSARTLLRPGLRFEFYAGLLLPGVMPWTDEQGGTWLAHADGSWANYVEGVVVQGGPRSLWDLAETAYEQWDALDRPCRDRFGLTVTPEAQYFWLDTPDSPHRWPLA